MLTHYAVYAFKALHVIAQIFLAFKHLYLSLPLTHTDTGYKIKYRVINIMCTLTTFANSPYRGTAGCVPQFLQLRGLTLPQEAFSRISPSLPRGRDILIVSPLCRRCVAFVSSQRNPATGCNVHRSEIVAIRSMRGQKTSAYCYRLLEERNDNRFRRCSFEEEMTLKIPNSFNRYVLNTSRNISSEYMSLLTPEAKREGCYKFNVSICGIVAPRRLTRFSYFISILMSQIILSREFLAKFHENLFSRLKIISPLYSMRRSN